MEVIEHDSCRVCFKKELQPIVSLGEQYIIDFPDSQNQEGVKARLDLVLCNEIDGGCGLLQLKHTVPEEILYRNFWYKSGVNQSMRDALKNITDRVKEKIILNSNDIIIDIGANLTHEQFNADRDEVVQRARAAGIVQMVVTGASAQGSVD